MGAPLAISLRNREHERMKDDIKAEGERFLAQHAKADADARAALRPKGRDLARRLSVEAVDLAMNKATEFSPDIKVLILLAAEVAYLSFGAGTPELEPFESAVYYYANFTPPDPIVAVYDAFKQTQS
jgi:hypothetical protein